MRQTASPLMLLGIVCLIVSGCCSVPCGPIPTAGGCATGDCTSCGPSYGQGRLSDLIFPLLSNQLTCGSGCGVLYWNEWLSDPPDCTDPCDNHGCYVGHRFEPQGRLIYSGWSRLWGGCLGFVGLHSACESGMCGSPACGSPACDSAIGPAGHGPAYCNDCLANGANHSPPPMIVQQPAASPMNRLAVAAPMESSVMVDGAASMGHGEMLADETYVTGPIGSGMAMQQVAQPHAGHSTPHPAHAGLHGAEHTQDGMPFGIGGFWNRLSQVGTGAASTLTGAAGHSAQPPHAPVHYASQAQRIRHQHGRPPHSAATPHLQHR